MVTIKAFPINKVKLPLFWKFAIAISLTVLLFGTLNLLFIRHQVYRTFEAQIERNGLSIASITAEQITDHLLYNEIAALNNHLQKTKSVVHDIKYLMVISPDNQVIAHTFNSDPPQSLINANQLNGGLTSGIKIIHSLSRNDTIIRDFATPILEKRLGTLRIGFSEHTIQQRLEEASRMFIFLVFGLLIFGLIAAFFLSYIISEPLKKMSYQVSKINLSSLESRDYGIDLDTNNKLLKLKNLFNMTDEIDVLGNSFNQMLFRLNLAYIELERTRESLSHTEKLASVGTLAAGLAHEINNPLTGISNCIRRISDKPENIEQNREYFNMMNEAISKISKVVKGLLDFSRKHEMNFSRINIIRHIENSLSLINFQVQQAGIILKRDYELNEIYINGSPNHLEQVFINLLLNSVDSIQEKKATDPSFKGKITIKLKTEGQSVKIEFIDNGIGLSPDKIKLIFEPFFTEKKARPGTGLGLTVSYDIIRNHNGQITGANEDDGGFRITIILPQPDKQENTNNNDATGAF
jgi:signal transduction histidine kinase